MKRIIHSSAPWICSVYMCICIRRRGIQKGILALHELTGYRYKQANYDSIHDHCTYNHTWGCINIGVRLNYHTELQ